MSVSTELAIVRFTGAINTSALTFPRRFSLEWRFSALTVHSRFQFVEPIDDVREGGDFGVHRRRHRWRRRNLNRGADPFGCEAVAGDERISVRGSSGKRHVG